MNQIITFTDFLLAETKEKEDLTLLLIQIENAAKIIASHVRESGLVDILGATGRVNSFQEEVQKLDEFSNKKLIEMLQASGQTYALISEEVAEPILTPKRQAGEYIVYFDPLDGSSNIDVNAPIGTIFSIYHKGSSLLQPGTKQVAAGYIIYGSSTMLVYTNGKKVNGFTIDPSMGSFLLSHPDIKIPEEGHIYSINEAYSPFFCENVQKYLAAQKLKQKASLRYIGSLIADIHRTLLKGGIFLYPADTKHPEGKLRLMLEANPMALILETAGGMAIQGKTSILQTNPTHIHQRIPLIAGSKKNVLEYLQYQ